MKRLLDALALVLGAFVAGSAAATGDVNTVGAAYTISNAPAGNALVVYTPAL
jgi:hypothetical protein